MAGLVPAIHVFFCYMFLLYVEAEAEDVDARLKAGHDEQLSPSHSSTSRKQRDT
jgi:hypothetical protein